MKVGDPGYEEMEEVAIAIGSEYGIDFKECSAQRQHRLLTDALVAIRVCKKIYGGSSEKTLV